MNNPNCAGYPVEFDHQFYRSFTTVVHHVLADSLALLTATPSPPCCCTIADDGIVYGSRHNYNGGGSTNLCLKNAAGDQGGVRQGSQDSNDMVVPLKREHADYNNLPSRNNLLRSRNSYVIPCAKCQYAKSCFEETGVAECPNGYHKMYTGYMFGGHESHRGNNDRICIDKNPASNDCEVYSFLPCL